MIHQVMGGAEGQATDVEIQTREIVRVKRSINEIMAKHTGKTLAQVEKDTDRDFYMTAGEAKKYGIVDQVIKS